MGKGKGGYSYLATDGQNQYVLKQIHHEPCSYYSFGNKIEAEINDYKRLSDIGIRIPKMLAVDIENERILKEYIEGETIYELVKKDANVDLYIEQVKEMCKLLYPSGTNIDYFPTNFVVKDNLIYYIDSRYGKIGLITANIFELKGKYYKIVDGVDYWAYNYCQLGH